MALHSSRLAFARASCCYHSLSTPRFLPLQTAPTAMQKRVQLSSNTNSPSSLDLRNLLVSILQLQMSGNKVDVSDIDILHQLTKLLQESPTAAECVWEVGGVVPKLVELQDCEITEVEEQARVCLSLLGYIPPYSGRGLRILSIDGGGTRLGLVGLIDIADLVTVPIK